MKITFFKGIYQLKYSIERIKKKCQSITCSKPNVTPSLLQVSTDEIHIIIYLKLKKKKKY